MIWLLELAPHPSSGTGLSVKDFPVNDFREIGIL